MEEPDHAGSHSVKNGLKTLDVVNVSLWLDDQSLDRVDAIVSVISRPRRCSDESCKRAGRPTRNTGSSLDCA